MVSAGAEADVALAGATGVLSGQTASDGGLDISQANKALMHKSRDAVQPEAR